VLVHADFETTEGERIKGPYKAEWDTPRAHAGAMHLKRGAECWRIERGDLVAAQLRVISWSNIDLELAEFNGLSIQDGQLVTFPGEYETVGATRGICRHRLNHDEEEFLDYIYARWRQPDPVDVRPRSREEQRQ